MGIRGKNAGWKNTNTITTLQLYNHNNIAKHGKKKFFKKKE